MLGRPVHVHQNYNGAKSKLAVSYRTHFQALQSDPERHEGSSGRASAATVDSDDFLGISEFAVADIVRRASVADIEEHESNDADTDDAWRREGIDEEVFASHGEVEEYLALDVTTEEV